MFCSHPSPLLDVFFDKIFLHVFFVEVNVVTNVSTVGTNFRLWHALCQGWRETVLVNGRPAWSIELIGKRFAGGGFSPIRLKNMFVKLDHETPKRDEHIKQLKPPPGEELFFFQIGPRTFWLTHPCHWINLLLYFSKADYFWYHFGHLTMIHFTFDLLVLQKSC